MESLPDTEIYYTLDGSKPSKSSSLYTGSAPSGGKLHAESCLLPA
ncbi:chitobiase/beta-hexosaminidase C-terminal domain-containing protein [Bacteroides thetaiotaomicron]|nr:chitobiase/beta-hexosaminidase C-terminal domain-containing protein [Bacteroides thetaiotaomicron]